MTIIPTRLPLKEDESKYSTDIISRMKRIASYNEWHKKEGIKNLRRLNKPDLEDMLEGSGYNRKLANIAFPDSNDTVDE